MNFAFMTLYMALCIVEMYIGLHN